MRIERKVVADQPQFALQKAVSRGILGIEPVARDLIQFAQKIASYMLAADIVRGAFPKQHRFARIIARKKRTKAVLDTLERPVSRRSASAAAAFISSSQSARTAS
jgi:hypothetical protein